MFSTTVHTDPIVRSTVNPASFANNVIKTQTGTQPPAIKSIADQEVARRSERDREIAHLLSIKLSPVATTAVASNIPVLKVRSQTPMSAEQATAAGFRVVNQGVPEHGVILHYGQIHNVYHFEPGSGADRTSSLNVASDVQAVSRCQRKIFDELLSHKIEHVFCEGLDSILVPDTFAADSRGGVLRDRIRIMLRDYRPGKQLDPTTALLLSGGAGFIYSHFASGVCAYPTATSEQVQNRLSYLAANADRIKAGDLSIPQTDRALLIDEPEQVAVKFIKQVMQGKSMKVALIFGKSHLPERFVYYFHQQSFSPAFYSKDATA
jgi:hypothetical protein